MAGFVASVIFVAGAFSAAMMDLWSFALALIIGAFLISRLP